MFPWIRGATSPPTAHPEPGAPIVRALHTGLAQLGKYDDVVVKLDADVSFARDYFERLLQAFEADPALGIAGGECLELAGGEWRAVHVTSSHVRGAVARTAESAWTSSSRSSRGSAGTRWTSSRRRFTAGASRSCRASFPPPPRTRRTRRLPVVARRTPGAGCALPRLSLLVPGRPQRLSCSDEPDSIRHALGLRRERGRPSARAPRRSSSRRAPSATGARRASDPYPRGVRPAVVIVALTQAPPSANGSRLAAACTRHTRWR